MMYLRTGTPGAGKTLSTIDEVLKRADKEGREVYYTNIEGMNLDGWTELDNAEEWHKKIPDNAIYVCDEFYEVFPKLGITAKRPEHYQLLAKHRHKGLDVYLVCQGVQQIDDFLKPLFENHYHLIRSEMFEQSKIFKSKGFITSPHTKGGRKDLETSSYVFNKDLYDKYKSATIHTHKKRIPKVYKQLAIMLCLALASFLFVKGFFTKKITGESETVQQTVQSVHETVDFREMQKEVANIDDFEPRNDLPQSAAAYDSLRLKVNSYPRLQCFNNNGFCTCYTQQATKLKLDNTTCLNYMNHRDFEPSEKDWALIAKDYKMRKLYPEKKKEDDKTKEINNTDGENLSIL